MLKRVISTSPRLAALKNDTNRLLYTWLIPFLDVEGRIEADPRIIKGHVAPLLDHISTRTINAALADMAANDLIVLYEANGQKYLQLQRFAKHQVLRDGREKKSDIPSPADGVPTEYRRATDGGATDNRRHTARQEKLSKEKISKGKGSETDQPVDNSEQEQPKEAPTEKKKLLKEMATIIGAIREKYPDHNYHRQVQLFVESNIVRANHQAIIHCLNRLLNSEARIDKPKPFLEGALWGDGSDKNGGENAKYNAREADEKCQEQKRGCATIGDLTAGIRAAMEGR